MSCWFSAYCCSTDGWAREVYLLLEIINITILGWLPFVHIRNMSGTIFMVVVNWEYLDLLFL